MWGRRAQQEPEPWTGECDLCGRTIHFETELHVVIDADWGYDGEAWVFCGQEHALEHLAAGPFVPPERTDPSQVPAGRWWERAEMAFVALSMVGMFALATVGAYAVVTWLLG